MDLSAGAAWFVIPLQIFVVDLLLGADNALLIAVACNGLDARDVRRAATIGAGGAIVLRLLLATVAASLLTVPLVKLIGAWALIVIALNVSADCKHALPTREPGAARRDLWAAATAIVVADAVMSLDNVVALAAIARGNFWLLAAGVVLSIPVLAYGGLILSAAAARRSVAGQARRGAARLDRRRHGGDRSAGRRLDPAVNAPALAAYRPGARGRLRLLRRPFGGAPVAVGLGRSTVSLIPPEAAEPARGAAPPPRPRPSGRRRSGGGQAGRGRAEAAAIGAARTKRR